MDPAFLPVHVGRTHIRHICPSRITVFVLLLLNGVFLVIHVLLFGRYAVVIRYALEMWKCT